MVRPGEIRATVDLAAGRKPRSRSRCGRMTGRRARWPSGSASCPRRTPTRCSREAVEAARTADAAVVVVGSGPGDRERGVRPARARPARPPGRAGAAGRGGERTGRWWWSTPGCRCSCPGRTRWPRSATAGCPGRPWATRWPTSCSGRPSRAAGCRSPSRSPRPTARSCIRCPSRASWSTARGCSSATGAMTRPGYSRASRSATAWATRPGSTSRPWRTRTAAGPDGDLGLTVVIRNTGPAGRDVRWSRPTWSRSRPETGRPVRALAAFAAATAGPGERAEVRLAVPGRAFARYDETGPRLGLAARRVLRPHRPLIGRPAAVRPGQVVI